MSKSEKVSTSMPEQGDASRDRAMHEAIEELREPIRTILDKLHEHINAGDYRLIIGEDASGRVPALIISKVIREIYKKRGIRIPRTMTAFVAGGDRLLSPGKKEELADHILKYYVGDNIEDSQSTKSRGRVLIVDDTVVSGGSIEPLSDALTSINIEYDIATIGVAYWSLADYAYMKKKLGGNIYFGQGSTPSIYEKKKLAGVTKDPEKIFSSPRVSESSIEARKDIGIVADELAEWYLATY